MTKAVIIIPYRHIYDAPDGIEMLLGRKQRKIHIGKFVFPGGKVEKLETALNCAARELYEETGIQLPHSEFEYCGNLSFLNYKTREKVWDIYVYRVKISYKDLDSTKKVREKDSNPELGQFQFIPYDYYLESKSNDLSPQGDQLWVPFCFCDILSKSKQKEFQINIFEESEEL